MMVAVGARNSKALRKQWSWTLATQSKAMIEAMQVM